MYQYIPIVLENWNINWVELSFSIFLLFFNNSDPAQRAEELCTNDSATCSLKLVFRHVCCEDPFEWLSFACDWWYLSLMFECLLSVFVFGCSLQSVRSTLLLLKDRLVVYMCWIILDYLFTTKFKCFWCMWPKTSSNQKVVGTISVVTNNHPYTFILKVFRMIKHPKSIGDNRTTTTWNKQNKASTVARFTNYT